MHEAYVSFLQELQVISQVVDLEEKVTRLEQVSQTFDSLTREGQSTIDTVLLSSIIQTYEQLIQQMQRDKQQLSQEIARLNQSNQAVKSYLPLEELSGIELTY